MEQIKFSIDDIKCKLSRSQMRDILGGCKGVGDTCSTTKDCPSGTKCCQAKQSNIYRCNEPKECKNR